MKKQTKVLATSIATIAMCASLAVGGTFALFTSEDEVNIAVTAGTVKIEATAKDLDKSDLYSGQAAINGGTVSIENMLPGDSVTFKVDVTNYSTVPAQYRTILTSEDGGLADALTISFDKATTQAPISFLGGYGVDGWDLLPAAAEGGEVVETITVTIAFNSQGNAIDNLYQGKDCAYKVYVEAVQGNAEVVDPLVKDEEETDIHSDTYYIYSEEGMRLMTAVADATPFGSEFFLNFKLMNDLDMTGVPYYSTTRYWVTFDGNGHTIENLTAVHNPNDIVKKAGLFGYGNNVKNLTLKNVNVTGNQAGLVVGATDGNTLSNITIEGNNNSVTWVDSGLGWMDGGIGALVGVAHMTNITDVTVADGAKITLHYNGLANQLDYFDDELGGCFLQAPVLTNITVGANAIVKDGEFWYLATGAASLRNGVSKGYNVKMTTNIELDADANAPYGNNYGIAQNGGVLDGDDYSLRIEGTLDSDGKKDDYAIMTSGGTIKNLKLSNCFRAIMIMYPQSDVVIDNVIIQGDGVCYTVNTGEAGAQNIKLIVKNSTIAGWTSIGTAVSSVEFVNCDFVQGTYHKNDNGRSVKPYVNATFDNCRFVEDMYFDGSAFEGDRVDFKNCSMLDGTEITAQNLMLLFNSGVYPGGNDWKLGGDPTADFVPVYVDGVRCAAMEYIADGLYKQVDGSYIVVNASGFKYLSEKSLESNAVLNIGANIDFSGDTVKASIVPSNGSLVVNGNGYTLSNVNIVSGAKDNTTGQASLFYCSSGGTLTVSDLTVNGATVQADINGSGYAGVIVGYNEGATTLTNVDVLNSTVNGEKSCAILVGFTPAGSTLVMNGCDVGEDCSVNATRYNAAAYVGRALGATTIAVCSVADDFVSTATEGWASKYIGQRYTGCSTCTIDGVEYVDAYSVQELIEKATEGTTLVLNECSMEYPTLVIRNANGSQKKNLTLKANGNVTLGAIDLNVSTFITIDGFTFDAAKAIAIYSGRDGRELRGWANIVSAGLANEQTYNKGARDITIANCTFVGKAEVNIKQKDEAGNALNGYSAISFDVGSLSSTKTRNITVTGCKFYVNALNYVRFYYSGDSNNEGAYVGVEPSVMTITNNVFGGEYEGTTYGTTHHIIQDTSGNTSWVVNNNKFYNWAKDEAAIGIDKANEDNVDYTIEVKGNYFYNDNAEVKVVYLKRKGNKFHVPTVEGNTYAGALSVLTDETAVTKKGA